MNKRVGTNLCKEQLRFVSFAAEQKTEAMILFDLEGNILFVNEAFASLHGYTSDELVGSHLSILHTQEQIPSVVESFWQLHETGEFSGEIWHIRRDGSPFPGMMRNSLLLDKGGKPIGIIGVLQDKSQPPRSKHPMRHRSEPHILRGGSRKQA